MTKRQNAHQLYKVYRDQLNVSFEDFFLMVAHRYLHLVLKSSFINIWSITGDYDPDILTELKLAMGEIQSIAFSCKSYVFRICVPKNSELIPLVTEEFLNLLTYFTSYELLKEAPKRLPDMTFTHEVETTNETVAVHLDLWSNQ